MYTLTIPIRLEFPRIFYVNTKMKKNILTLINIVFQSIIVHTIFCFDNN